VKPAGTVAEPEARGLAGMLGAHCRKRVQSARGKWREAGTRERPPCPGAGGSSTYALRKRRRGKGAPLQEPGR
jgi:hypothetical protein